MGLVEWTPEMSVGVESLDADHRRMFDMLNELFDTVAEGTESVLLPSLFDRLVDYTLNHFTREEGLMERGGFPDLKNHKEEHALLTARVFELRGRFLGGSVKNLNLELLVLFKTWLTSHIRVTDMRYKPYVMSSDAVRDWQSLPVSS
ncbi:MAG: bacteriohemerythrin [Rhodospirillaceae bacterium]